MDAFSHHTKIRKKLCSEKKIIKKHRKLLTKPQCDWKGNANGLWNTHNNEVTFKEWISTEMVKLNFVEKTHKSEEKLCVKEEAF